MTWIPDGPLPDIETRIAVAKRLEARGWEGVEEFSSEYFADAFAAMQEAVIQKLGARDAAAQAMRIVIESEEGKVLYEGSVRARRAPVEPRPAPPEPDPASAEGQLVKIAKGIRDADPTLTRAQAMATAVTRNPHLYDAYLANQ